MVFVAPFSTCFSRLIIDLLDYSAIESINLSFKYSFDSTIVHNQHVHPYSMWTNSSFPRRFFASKNVQQNKICHKL